MSSLAARPHVRLATPDDGAACAAIYAPYVTDTSISFELVPPDGDEMGARIARTIARTPWVAVEVDNAVRAYAYATRHRERPAYAWTVETAVYVDREFARQGLGSIAMRAVLGILRVQGAHLVVAGITLPNDGSVALHRALGFERIGGFEAIGWKQGGWHGVDWFALELGPRNIEPGPLVPLPQLAGGAALEAALAGALADLA